MGKPEFTKLRPEVIRKPLLCADDFLNPPKHILRRVQRELEIEALQEFLDARNNH